MKAQGASLPFTPVYAGLTAVINTKLPSIGELLLTRLVVQFRRAFKRNDKVSKRIAFGIMSTMHRFFNTSTLDCMLGGD
jgi:hypothetical protein